MTNIKTEKKMAVNWQITQVHPMTCMVSCATGGSHKRELVEDLLETNRVSFFIQPKTKTTLEISISTSSEKRSQSLIVAHIPAGSEKFKFLERNEGFYFSEDCTRYYFKVNKKQNYDELLTHLNNILYEVLKFSPSLETLTIDADIRFFHTEGMINFPSNLNITKLDRNGNYL